MAAAAGASLAVALAVPAPAFAHPRLLDATPAVDSVTAGAPDRVRLRFDEAVQAVAGGIDVRDPSGRQVAFGPFRLQGRTLSRAIRPGGHGTYVVEWLVVGDDSHPARGAFIFSIGEPTRSGVGTEAALGDALQASGRWLSLAGFVLGFGLPFACGRGRPGNDGAALEARRHRHCGDDRRGGALTARPDGDAAALGSVSPATRRLTCC